MICRLRRETQNTVIGVLEKRLNASAVKELILAPQGVDRIFLQMPGVGEEDARKIIDAATKAAKLEFSIIPTQQDDRIPGDAFSLGKAVNDGEQIVPGYRALPTKKAGENQNKGKEGEDVKRPEYVLLKLKADMAGDSVTKAYSAFGQKGWEIHITFDNKGAKQFGDLSAASPNRQMAIILDGEVLSYPGFYDGPIYGGNCVISGDFTQMEAMALAAAMANPLETPLTEESVSFISADDGGTDGESGDQCRGGRPGADLVVYPYLLPGWPASWRFWVC